MSPISSFKTIQTPSFNATFVITVKNIQIMTDNYELLSREFRRIRIVLYLMCRQTD